jgi:hypothetical protein
MERVQAELPHREFGGDPFLLWLHPIRGDCFGKEVKKQQVRRSFTPGGPVLLALYSQESILLPGSIEGRAVRF